MLSENKLLISDYDITYDLIDLLILYNNWRIRKFRKNGNVFAFSTYRGYAEMMKQIQRYNIPYDYLSLCGGRTVVDKNGVILHSESIQKEDILEMRDLLYDYILSGDVKIAYYDGKDNEAEEVCDVVRINIFIKNNRNEIVGKLKQINGIALRESFTNIDILKSGVDKVNGIYTIAEIEKTKRENIYTVGDSKDDSNMINEFNGYANIFFGSNYMISPLGFVFSVGYLADKIKSGYAKKRKL